jgi:hypothetical protein
VWFNRNKLFLSKTNSREKLSFIFSNYLLILNTVCVTTQLQLLKQYSNHDQSKFERRRKCVHSLLFNQVHFMHIWLNFYNIMLIYVAIVMHLCTSHCISVQLQNKYNVQERTKEVIVHLKSLLNSATFLRCTPKAVTSTRCSLCKVYKLNLEYMRNIQGINTLSHRRYKPH